MFDMKKDKVGRIITNNVRLEPHEYETVIFLANLGKTIELIPPSNTPHNSRADFAMDNLVWESKSPTGNSTRMTIDRILHKAVKQSENIVIDLRRTKIPDTQSIRYIKERFIRSRRIRRLLVVTRAEELLDFRKRS